MPDTSGDGGLTGSEREVAQYPKPIYHDVSLPHACLVFTPQKLSTTLDLPVDYFCAELHALRTTQTHSVLHDMFKSCFVARVAIEKRRNVELFCTFDDPQSGTSSNSDLPPAQALGGFCFPLGSCNVEPKEYMAPEVQPDNMSTCACILPISKGVPVAKHKVRVSRPLHSIAQEYSFTLTVGDGSRLHGFCRYVPPQCILDACDQSLLAPLATPHHALCVCRSFLPPRAAAAMGRSSSSLRYHQVLCIISQYPWFTFYYKILQVTEQLLKQDNVLTTYSKQQLAQNHPASLFLTDLCHQCPQTPIPGRVIR